MKNILKLKNIKIELTISWINIKFKIKIVININNR